MNTGRDIYDIYSQQVEKLPERAREEIEKSFIVMGEKCFRLYEGMGTWYVKGINLYGYRSIWCKVRVAGELKRSNMYLDFVRTDMSEARKFEYLWLMERNRDTLFDVFLGSQAKEGSDEYADYKEFVTQLNEDEIPKK